MKIMSDKAELDNSRFNDLINSDIASPGKKHMAEGERYYKGKNDILQRKITYFVGNEEVEDRTKSNIKVPHDFLSFLIKQKVNYAVGNPVAISSAKSELLKAVNKTIGKKFKSLIPKLCKEASFRGLSWLHPFIKENGEFGYYVIPASEIIAVYDSTYQEELVYVIRYYTYQIVTGAGEKQMRYKLEWWDKEKVEYWTQDINKNWLLDPEMTPNPCYHWYSFNTTTPDDVRANSWGKVPFIPLHNNDEVATDLSPIKVLIDIYDLALSDFANNLDEIQELIWVLKNYAGEELAEFVRNLRYFKAIKVEGDGDAHGETNEIPVEARDKFLTIVRKNIFLFGRGVDPSDENIANNPSGISLKIGYAGLDLKANELLLSLEAALYSFFEFVLIYLEMTGSGAYDVEDLTFTFNKSMIFNELEKVQMLSNSVGLISKRTITENHPLVSDPEEEQKRIDEEAANEPKLTLEDVKNSQVKK